MISVPVDDAPMVRLQVLGTVAATTEGHEIALGGPRARALLAALALAQGRILSADALMRDVWGQTTPGVRSALRANISRLRSTPLGGHLVGGRQGYALQPAPHLEVDLWRLGELSLDECAALVDVMPFDGASMSPFLPAARAGARALIRRTVIRAIDADTTHPLAILTAERLLARTPDDPELHALLLAVRAGSTVADLRGAAPAAATRRIGLPAPIAAYHPRPEDEVRLAAALRLSRLVTLVGPSGVGKSRLAIEWARGRGGATQEHVWFCRAGDGRDVWLSKLARAVGADDGTVDSIVARIGPLRGTILIDGLDDALDAAAADLAMLLESAPGVAALVTARLPLGVPGESVHRLGSLSIADARALFRLRSGAVSASEEVDAFLAELGRLPLAIELAAALTAQMPFASVIDALSAPLADAAASPLETAFAATFALLDEPTRETLVRLCVFRDPFERASAVALCGAAAGDDLDVLLAWSLLTDESRGDLALLQVPEVVRRRLSAAEDAAPIELRARHTAWFAGRTLAAFDELTTALAPSAWQRLDAERADIDAAFTHATEVGDRTSALSIAAGLAWAGLMSGTQAATLAITRSAAAVPGEATATLEARARLGHGILSYQLGFMDEAATVLSEALEFADRAGEPDLIALSHAFLAYLATLTPGGTRRAIEGIQSARMHLEEISPSSQAMVTLISAQVERSRGDHDEARRLADAAHMLARRSGHGWVLLMSSVVAAKVCLDARDPQGALGILRPVLNDPRVLAEPISVLIAASVAAGAAAGAGADAAGARIIGAVDAIGPRYGFDPRANEPADFDTYRRRVRQGLPLDAWRDAYAHGARLTLAELVDVTARL